VDVKAAGLKTLGKGEGYVRRQVEGWTGRYRRARTPDAADFETVMAWLAAKMPADDVAICVIHNDYRFDNVVLSLDDPFEVIGVLDWEMATLGDPLMDLGNALAYWMQADDSPRLKAIRVQPTHLPGMLTRDEVIAYYGEQTGYLVDNFDFYLIFGLFRLAVIVQQIYCRYYNGQTKNQNIAAFINITNLFHERCLELIGASEL
jgi:aminoglycoside phosphotransferase (APT) family kinase protein